MRIVPPRGKEQLGDHAGEVLECEPLRKLVYTWNTQDKDPPEVAKKRRGLSRVTYELKPMGDQVRLRLIHENLLPEDINKDPNTFQGINNGVAVYARVSTSDKDQNPETQLLPLREFASAQAWTVADEYVDHASATDLRGRTAWRELLDQAAKRRVDVILVWKLDRAFRSVAHMATTVEQLRRWGVGLRS